MRTALAPILLAAVSGCTGFTLYSESYMAEMGSAAYADILREYRVVDSGAQAEMVRRVGSRIAKASGKEYDWEFKLLDAPDEANAFCLPGGKIAVFTGILPITQNEDGLAAVVGHEVAHATEQHGNKRMSQQTVLSALLIGTAGALEYSKLDNDDQALVLGALGVGAKVGVMLPYSRSHESEADEVGLRYAIRAGYDPNEAPKLWDRMAQLGSAGPEFLSTHPNPSSRAQRLRELIPKLVAEERGR